MSLDADAFSGDGLDREATAVDLRQQRIDDRAATTHA
jgi:hypothetical protein